MKVYLWSFTDAQLDQMETGDTVDYQGKTWNVEWIASDCVWLS